MPGTDTTMPRWVAAVVTALSFPLGPGIVVVLIPGLITRWPAGAPYQVAVRAAGVALIAAAFRIAIVAFVRWYEEPALARRFGAQYEAYRRH